MAKRMLESATTIPQFSFFDVADATRLVQLRMKINPQANSEHIHLTYMSLFIYVLSKTLMQHPYANGTFQAPIHAQHIGIAMSTEQGLIVPVLRDVHQMNLEEVIHAFDRLKKKAKEKTLLPADMKGSTITITNFGALQGGGLFATPLINPPEVAILGLSRIRKQPVVVNDTIVIR